MHHEMQSTLSCHDFLRHFLRLSSQNCQTKMKLKLKNASTSLPLLQFQALGIVRVIGEAISIKAYQTSSLHEKVKILNEKISFSTM